MIAGGEMCDNAVVLEVVRISSKNITEQIL
jgi:hypothetical protein